MKRCKECGRRIWSWSSRFELLEICYPYEKVKKTNPMVYHHPESDMCYWCSILIYTGIEGKSLTLKGEFEKAEDVHNLIRKATTNSYFNKNINRSIRSLWDNYDLDNAHYRKQIKKELVLE